MQVFIIESIIEIIIFTILVLIMSINPLNTINDYPPEIIERCKKLNLINDEQLPMSKKVLIRKSLAAILFLIIFVYVIYRFNEARIFSSGFMISYGIWSIIDWYDAFILDCLYFCHNKRFIIPGTDDLVDAYHDYMFHIKGSLIGMIIGIPVCLLVGVLIKRISIII